jgi:hypothetical protein
MTTTAHSFFAMEALSVLLAMTFCIWGPVSLILIVTSVIDSCEDSHKKRQKLVQQQQQTAGEERTGD